MHVLDLFVKVPSGVAGPIKFKPMEVDAVSQVVDGREQRKRVTFDCKTNQLFDGRRSERGGQVQAI